MALTAHHLPNGSALDGSPSQVLEPQQHCKHLFEFAVEMDLVASEPLQFVRIERLAECLLADQRPVGQFLLPVRLYVIGGVSSNECSPCLIDGEAVIIGADGTHDFRALRGP